MPGLRPRGKRDSRTVKKTLALLALLGWVVPPLSGGCRTATHEPEAAAAPQWEYEAVVDEFTDEVDHTASVWASDAQWRLVATCSPAPAGFVGAFVLNLDLRVSDPVPVRYRVDSSAPVSSSWEKPEFDDYGVLLPVSESPGFVRALGDARERLVIELTGRDGYTSRATFSMANASTALGPLLRACSGD